MPSLWSLHLKLIELVLHVWVMCPCFSNPWLSYSLECINVSTIYFLLVFLHIHPCQVFVNKILRKIHKVVQSTLASFLTRESWGSIATSCRTTRASCACVGTWWLRGCNPTLVAQPNTNTPNIWPIKWKGGNCTKDFLTIFSNTNFQYYEKSSSEICPHNGYISLF